jgi:hypothetical protein
MEGDEGPGDRGWGGLSWRCYNVTAGCIALQQKHVYLIPMTLRLDVELMVHDNVKNEE